ncbi:pseudouridine-5'-phosphate glycosidase [Isachenkonia alkalipeptolytica]|uniref:Pseudouridine-5'-phosphate glycosidase n=1 Tax=Isachenkonia alkalipeptolytica TaxID=2565777 RepID=A0AA44BES5_9CLOT|nr:pseudouridine-5'-phosphate glycosidase [Isachenkonia alkalipeptolytica]NBG88485.1 pseudouridine-5'-phosphate glycosidase [Isachenkonia alkalipeptolytica]
MKKYMEIHPEVKKALEKGNPVVALESTIISHGMPYPKNLETAREVEKIIRQRGAVPATIGIMKGRLKIGLTEEELMYFATEKGILKTSRRDIPYITANKKDGATTVASTMILAGMAGIRVFVTGGIGGVHRGGQNTLDISADLMEFSKTDMAVICAGAKSILDIGLTLEYLETQGVPVVGFKTESFPAFYTRESGYKVDYQVDNGMSMARIMKDKWEMDLKGGIVIGNPIPREAELDPKFINDAIEKAIALAEEKGIQGKEVTPFLLSHLKEATKGRSLDANIELVYNNARVGADIAVAYATLKDKAP